MTDLIYTSIYKKLIKLIPHVFELEVGAGQTSKSSDYMDLHLDILRKEKDCIVIALAHNYINNGDSVPDPDMEIKIHRHEMAEALTYQDSFCFRRVYEEEGKFYVHTRTQLNKFLNLWLTNCLKQGHKFNK